MRTREEHIEWCKERAKEYLKEGDIMNAITSMLSDLGEHPETRMNNDYLTMLGMTIINNNDPREAKRFIEGFR
jgi:hypothetical protein